MKLVFKHLYDGRWGYIQKPRNRWEHPTITFPHDFNPEKGKSYSCRIVVTPAIFVYNNISYDVSTAHLENRANIIEKMDYKFKPHKTRKTAMQLAFEKEIEKGCFK